MSTFFGTPSISVKKNLIFQNQIIQVEDRFHDEDSVEWKRMRTEVKSMAKVCRTFQLKLKKAEEKSIKLKAENAQLVKSVSRDLRRRHQSLPMTTSLNSTSPLPPPTAAPASQGGTNEMVKDAVIWGAVLVAGYQFLKSKIT